MKKIFKNKYVIIGILALALLLVAYVTGRHATAQYPEKAVQLGIWIDEQSNAYDSANQKAIQLQKDLDLALADRTKAAQTAAGYRYSLCTEFALLRAAGGYTVKANGAPCASFPSGASPAL